MTARTKIERLESTAVRLVTTGKLGEAPVIMNTVSDNGELGQQVMTKF
jgi:hypothetical protein